MDKALKIFEKAIIFILLGIMMVVISLSLIDLIYHLIQLILASDFLVLGIDELFNLFGFILLLLISLELLQTVKMYLNEKVVHTEIVLEVAMIALARKIIITDFEKVNSLNTLSVAAILLVLAVAYFLQKTSRKQEI
ncbi:MAG TPA: phosphate-starvation-inducible PsiE family protein [Bacteroidales bacterium]|nr:phosphate-starvation-inducible PsiE family protein [Bacteroidales bacterium]HQH41276.1 phosphate-starvation-inducible PsiE family protein [Bacteroidales bacterium]HQK37344.1 phosphate-starvation-inducible PsiE family protein [Bacteroidales bacterium]